MGRPLAIMVTMTTYGTWLRGDARGWVDQGTVFPADPVLEAADRVRAKHPPYFFPRHRLWDVGQYIGRSLSQRLGVRLWAMTVRRWHAHFVVACPCPAEGRIAKCVKDAARWGLRVGRPLWGAGYDTRYCIDRQSVRNRIQYVQDHNPQVGLPPKPWAFIESPPWTGSAR